MCGLCSCCVPADMIPVKRPSRAAGRRAVTHACQASSYPRQRIKFSKQSALAVLQHLRDNQHQSIGRPRYALA